MVASNGFTSRGEGVVVVVVVVVVLLVVVVVGALEKG